MHILTSDRILYIIKSILEQGHYVNITTNGTMTNRFKEIITWPKELLKNLFFSFSLHYIELKKNNLEAEIVKRNTKLVNAFIRRHYGNLLVETDDLFQVCYIAM